MMWLKIHSGETQLRHSIAALWPPPNGASGGSTCNADNELLTSKDPISHVSRWVKLLHGANDILVIQLFFDKTDERWGEKRLSYLELHSNFGCGKLRNFHPAVVFAF